MYKELKRIKEFIDEGNLNGVTCDMSSNEEKLTVSVDGIPSMKIKINHKDNDMDVRYLITGDRRKAVTAEWVINKIAIM